MKSSIKSIAYKICKKCKVEKTIGDFYKHSGMSDGHLNTCIDCRKEYSAEYRSNNKDKNRILRQKWAEDNREKDRGYKKKWKIKNKEFVLKSKSEYAKNNRSKYNLWTNNYRASKKNATVELTEFEELWMAEIYDLAKLKTDLYSDKYEVDHIVPIVSEDVCGLHTPYNLAVIKKSLNQSKGNRYWPDSWGEQV